MEDQIGFTTYTYDFAELLLEMIDTDKYGVYHATNEGYSSWYEFACEIFKQAGVNVKVNSIKTEDYPTKARIPKNSRLSKNRLYNKRYEYLRDWKKTIRRYIYESHS